MGAHVLEMLSAYNGARQFVTHILLPASANLPEAMSQKLTHLPLVGSANRPEAQLVATTQLCDCSSANRVTEAGEGHVG